MEGVGVGVGVVVVGVSGCWSRVDEIIGLEIR